MDKTYIIYKFTNKTNGKSYIGVTNRGFKTRRYEHVLTSTKSPKFKFHQAIKKYGIDNFEHEILVENVLTKDEANKLEIHYIYIFDSYKNGYNMTQGGGNRGEFKHTDESKNKMSKSHCGKILSKEHAGNISKSLSGKPKSDEHRLNVIKANTGKKRSPEQIIKMSEVMVGKYKGENSPSAIIVNIYDNDNNLKFSCNGNFEKTCKENDLPIRALRRSYYSNGKKIYKNKEYKKFFNWYAIRI